MSYDAVLSEARARMEKALGKAGFGAPTFVYEPVGAAYQYEAALDHDELGTIDLAAQPRRMIHVRVIERTDHDGGGTVDVAELMRDRRELVVEQRETERRRGRRAIAVVRRRGWGSGEWRAQRRRWRLRLWHVQLAAAEAAVAGREPAAAHGAAAAARRGAGARFGQARV